MNIDELLTSGTLELYVLGSLSQREAQEVEDVLRDYPAVKKEIESIETGLLEFTTEKELSPEIWKRILQSIHKTGKPDPKVRSIHWPSITGWAAAIVLMAGIFWMLEQNNRLENEIVTTKIEADSLETEVSKFQSELAESNELLDLLRSKEYQAIPLPGNPDVAPEAFAKIYFNAQEKVAYVDIQGLPEPPSGKVYQVWSLLVNPLTPRSIGVLDTGTTNHIYRLENIPDPEAFGITLEPEGGSETPTLSQLYTLGTVSP